MDLSSIIPVLSTDIIQNGCRIYISIDIMGIQLTIGVFRNLDSDCLFPFPFCIPVSIVRYTVNMLFCPSLVFLFCPPFPSCLFSVVSFCFEASPIGRSELYFSSFPFPPNSAFYISISCLACPLPHPSTTPPMLFSLVLCVVG